VMSRCCHKHAAAENPCSEGFLPKPWVCRDRPRPSVEAAESACLRCAGSGASFVRHAGGVCDPLTLTGSCDPPAIDRRSEPGSLVVSDRCDPHALTEVCERVGSVEVVDRCALLVE
jgi:hypothetical protein